ncbi:MAG: hypothetical protein Q8P80_00495 [Candidatus Levybacteria bacterium]|nr:hypothetical protein [Candidatus Levybacteria bacterium]
MSPQASEKKWEQLCLFDKSGELYKIQSFDHFVSWLKAHPELNIDDPVGYWEGKKIIDGFIEKHHDSQMRGKGRVDANSMPGELSNLSMLFLIPFLKNKIVLIEDDEKYKGLAKEAKDKWKKENNKEDFNSKEGLDYLYGNLDDPDAPSLKKDIQKTAENDPEKKKMLDELEQKYAKEKTKIYTKPEEDPRLIRTKELIGEETKARFEVLKKQDVTQTFEELHEKVKNKRWTEFAQNHPEKAKAYLEKHEEIKKAVNLLDTKKKLIEFQEKTSKEIKVTEKIHRGESAISTEQATQRLEEINKNNESLPKSKLANPQGQAIPITKSPARESVQSNKNVRFPIWRKIVGPRRTMTTQQSSPSQSQPAQPPQTGQSRRGGGGPPRRGMGPKELANSAKNLAKLGKNASKLLKAAPLFANPVVLGIIGGVILLIMIISFIGAFQGSNNKNNTAEASPENGNLKNTDIAACKFTRSDQTPKEASFKSQKLLNYISNASSLSTIPNVVFAAFIRVESPSSVNLSDSEVDGFCPESTDGALGIMQIVPHFSPRKDAICDTCLQNGAKLLGTTVDKLTKNDYCDPKKNLVIGAGFILKKMQYLGFGDGTKWDSNWTTDLSALRALANGYYGCYKYPSCSTGPYDYGQDLYTSTSNCRVSNSTTPPPINPATLRQDIGSQFNIEFDASFNNTVLTWAWEILWKARSETPNFFTMLKNKNGGKVIFITVTSGTGNTSGNTIAFSGNSGGPLSNPDFFKQNLIHELSHIIHGVRGDPLYKNGITTAFENDGGFISAYALGATSGAGACNTRNSGELEVQLDEDFAETLSYYINNNVPEQNYSNNCKPTNSSINPFSTGKYPNHLRFVKSLLGGNNF